MLQAWFNSKRHLGFENGRPKSDKSPQYLLWRLLVPDIDDFLASLDRKASQSLCRCASASCSVTSNAATWQCHIFWHSRSGNSGEGSG